PKERSPGRGRSGALVCRSVTTILADRDGRQGTATPALSATASNQKGRSCDISAESGPPEVARSGREQKVWAQSCTCHRDTGPLCNLAIGFGRDLHFGENE